MPVHAVHAGGDVEQTLCWRLHRVNHGDAFLRVVGQHRARFSFISVEPFLDHLLVGVVEPVIFQSALFQTQEQRFAIRTSEMEDFSDVDHVLHDFCLTDISRNAIKHESIDIGFKFVTFDRSIDGFLPKLHRNLVGHELAFAGVVEEGFAYFCSRIDGTENIAAGAVKKARNAAEGFALCAFAASGRTEEDERLVFHRNWTFFYKTNVKSVQCLWRIGSQRGSGANFKVAEARGHYFAGNGSTFTRRPARSKRTFPSTNA